MRNKEKRSKVVLNLVDKLPVFDDFFTALQTKLQKIKGIAERKMKGLGPFSRLLTCKEGL